MLIQDFGTTDFDRYNCLVRGGTWSEGGCSVPAGGEGVAPLWGDVNVGRPANNAAMITACAQSGGVPQLESNGGISCLNDAYATPDQLACHREGGVWVPSMGTYRGKCVSVEEALGLVPQVQAQAPAARACLDSGGLWLNGQCIPAGQVQEQFYACTNAGGSWRDGQCTMPPPAAAQAAQPGASLAVAPDLSPVPVVVRPRFPWLLMGGAVLAVLLLRRRSA